jgi:GGDEF domain-containing protein
MTGWRGVCAAALLFLCGHVFSAPQINWDETLARKKVQSSRAQQNLEMDLRQSWESSVVSDVKEANETPLDPEQIWAWPVQRFATQQGSGPVFLQNNQRLITRTTIFSERLAGDLMLSVMMPRVDAVHVSYRHDGGPWTTFSAGDRLAIECWPLVDRQPSFNVPLPPGQLDVVMQFAHRGIMDTPTLLQNNRAFLESRTRSIWAVGIAMGIHIVMALMGILLALNYQKLSFLSVSAMSAIMAVVLMFSSGLGGMIMFTGSSEFNDQSKFISNTVWGCLLPLVFAVAIGIRAYSKRWWRMSLAVSLGGLVLSVVLSSYALRDDSSMGIRAMLLIAVAFVSVLVGWAWLQNYSRNIGLISGLLLYCSCLFLLFAGYQGMMSPDASGMLISAVTTLASLVMLRGLFVQHRMGRQVIARASMSPMRDVLTGLLNREGIQAHVYKLRERLLQQQTCAVFIYVSVLDTQIAMEEHGEQGFEMGMVQIAASLSTSVTNTDGVSRVSGHAFGISVLMPPDPALAIRMAQKILSRLMALASHGAPMASTARIALAWMPLNGFRVDTIERSCIAALQLLENGKRIGWVGGVESHKDASRLLRDSSLALGTSKDMAQATAETIAEQDANSSNLYERIHRIEREMLQGTDTQFLVEEAERLSQVLNAQHIDQPTTQYGEDGPVTLQEAYQPMPQTTTLQARYEIK